MNRRRLLRDFSRIPGKYSAQRRTSRFLREVRGRIPFKTIDLTALKNIDLTAFQKISLTSLLHRLGWDLDKGKRTPKRCIGIDIGRSHVHAVQMARTPEGIQVEKGLGTQTRRSTDSLTRVLRSLTDEHGFDAHADVAVSLPHHTFFFADIETDPGGVETIRAGDTASLKDCFPIPAEDIIAQICSVLPGQSGKQSLLVAAASCESLREQLNVLSEAGIKPARIDTPTTAAYAAITANHPEAAKGLAVVLYVDEATLSIAVTRDSSILLVRNLPMFSDDAQDARTLARQTAEVLAQEIEITWNRLFGKNPDAGLRIFLVASRRMAGLLAPAIGEKTDSRVVPIDPYAGVARAEAIEADFSLCVAEGLALQTLQPQTPNGIDFLAAYRSRTRPPGRTKRELAVCGGLAGAVAAVWAFGLFLQLSSLESQYTRLKQQEQTIFRKAAPEEQNIVNPAAQLQQKLDALRKDCELFTCFRPGHPAPLETLSTLSRQMPGRGSLRLDEVLIASDSIRITGSCDSYDTFYEWQRLLAQTPGLRLVDDPRPKKDAGKVTFTVSLSTTEKKAS